MTISGMVQLALCPSLPHPVVDMGSQYTFRGQFDCQDCGHSATLYSNISLSEKEVNECNGCGDETTYVCVNDSGMTTID